MMSPSEIRQWAVRRYPEWLCSLVVGEPFFPREVRFGKPSATSDFSALKAAFEALTHGEQQVGYRIAWEDRVTKHWGPQRFPARVWFENEQGFLQATGKEAETRLFRSHLQMTRDLCPSLLPWLARHAVSMAEVAYDWPAVLSVATYFLKCPKPSLYARQLPIPVATKFIDQRHDILRPVLEFLLDGQLNIEATTFNARFHLLEDEPQVRLRFLNSECQHGSGFPVSDLTIPLSQFRALEISPGVAVVVENKMCFLTLPKIPDGVAIWGQGKAATLLHHTPWLRKTRLLYWGDMDDSGYSILSSLRHEYPQTESMLMDDLAWVEYQHLTRSGRLDPSPPYSNQLTSHELVAWTAVRSRSQMIEQEQIPISAVEDALRRFLAHRSNTACR